MNLSPAGLQLIERSEGFSSTVYNDVAGIPTIGYGHKLRPGESFPDGITQAQAQAILSNDVQSAEAAVRRLVTVPLNQGQFDALVGFTYNLGSGNLESSTLLKDLNAGNYDAAAQQILRWDHAGGKVQPGLQTRRQTEFNMFTAPAPADA
ncbi:MAG: lysozyme [Acidobacteriota bacterium]